MTKTQRRKQRSEQWKKDNDWGLSPAERTAKRIARCEGAIKTKIELGQDASILIDLLNQVKGE